MSNITYDYMEEYIRGLIKDEDDFLKELEEFAKENSVPIIHKEVGRFLEVLINIKKPKRILELGTAIGYSAILMEKASQGKSSITTIERDRDMVALANENIKKSGYEEKIKIVEGDCLEVLSKIDEKFDLIFMDAGKGHYNHFFPECLRLLGGNGIIVGDNVLFRGMVASDHLVKRRKITIVKRMRKFLDMVSQEEFLTSIIPMGDGLALITRRNK
ncbi:O-methyltransferase [Clostridium tetani]|uniref:O-methyltransferase n=1 Tax=Clostridium tetani TaxID=1513 RepID=UPI000513C6F7|nr:O-methyltransferase [Clostridium tetani]KGI42473.1 methyltransferase [Clostridium tetani]RXI55031.1 O-methyltransferase [Clostridium tetani]RXI55253.1 O-methyltransferase [Clostridium tetani]RXI72098.1 O-methyltransferase [Clostridium tetani]